MATSKKGGVLILDFKDEDAITTTSKKTKEYFFSKILNTMGKEIKIINLDSPEFGITREMILTIVGVSNYPNEIGLYYIDNEGVGNKSIKFDADGDVYINEI